MSSVLSIDDTSSWSVILIALMNGETLWNSDPRVIKQKPNKRTAAFGLRVEIITAFKWRPHHPASLLKSFNQTEADGLLKMTWVQHHRSQDMSKDLLYCHVCCRKQRASYLIMKEVSEEHTLLVWTPLYLMMLVNLFIFLRLCWVSEVVLAVNMPSGETSTFPPVKKLQLTAQYFNVAPLEQSSYNSWIIIICLYTI